MTLDELLDDYSRQRDISQGTESAYRTAIGSLCRFARREVYDSDLWPQLLNGWIDSMLARGRARITIRNQSMAILTLWRSTQTDGETPSGLRAVRRVRVPRPIPIAWFPDEELPRLLAATSKAYGYHRPTGISYAAMARAWLLVGYYSGLRGCDLLGLPLRQALGGRPFVVRQSKTDYPVTVSLPPDAIDAVRATLPPDRERFLPIHRSTLHWLVTELTKCAGLEGSPKWIRKTGATAVELHTPGGAMAYLGHKTPGLAYRHYVDQRIVGVHRPTPGRLKI